jgi:hypothetical protein
VKTAFLSLLLFLPTLAFADVDRDPSWFNRQEAARVSWQLSSSYNNLLHALVREVGSRHPIYRDASTAMRDAQNVDQALRSNRPFEQVAHFEKRYYQGSWVELQRSWPRQGRLYAEREYRQVHGLTEQLRRSFSPSGPRPRPRPPQWVGNCHVVLETVWGRNLRSYYGRGFGLTEQDAVAQARADGSRQCEQARGGDVLQKCTVDRGQCSASLSR